MDQTFLSFCTVVVNPGEQVKVSTYEYARLTITSASIVYKDDLPKQGRVVLYVSAYDSNGDIGQKIAFAPLRVCDCEVVTLDLETFSPLLFSTEGSEISVTISGYTDTPEPLIVDRIKKE